MKDYPSLDRVAELQALIADLAKVKRKVTLADNPEFEDDVQHSYGLAMTCWYLAPKIVPNLDLFEILKIALSHDIVEVHAGDAYYLDPEYSREKKELLERDAIKQLRSDWPDFSDPIDHAEAYMNKASEEALFVKAVDKILPVIMLGLGEGMQVHLDRNGLTMPSLRENKLDIHTSKHISPYYELLFEWLEKTEARRAA